MSKVKYFLQIHITWNVRPHRPEICREGCICSFVLVEDFIYSFSDKYVLFFQKPEWKWYFESKSQKDQTVIELIVSFERYLS